MNAWKSRNAIPVHPKGFALAKEQSPPVRANGLGALRGGLGPPDVQTLRAEHRYCKPKDLTISVVDLCLQSGHGLD